MAESSNQSLGRRSEFVQGPVEGSYESYHSSLNHPKDQHVRYCMTNEIKKTDYVSPQAAFTTLLPVLQRLYADDRDEYAAALTHLTHFKDAKTINDTLLCLRELRDETLSAYQSVDIHNSQSQLGAIKDEFTACYLAELDRYLYANPRLDDKEEEEKLLQQWSALWNEVDDMLTEMRIEKKVTDAAIRDAFEDFARHSQSLSPRYLDHHSEIPLKTLDGLEPRATTAPNSAQLPERSDPPRLKDRSML